MAEIVNAMGLSCPEPVIKTLEKIKKVSKGELEIWVDTCTSRENVIRAAKSMGWEVIEIKEENQVYKIKIKKE